MARKRTEPVTPHNLVPGHYRVNPISREVVAGPFGSRMDALNAAGTGPCVLLEVVGDLVAWGG